MQPNRIRGPLVSLAAVAALGGGLWWLNVSQEVEVAPSPSAVTQSTTAAAPPLGTPPPVTAPRVSFPAAAKYAGSIPTKSGTITLDITVAGREATAYACDGDSLEAWLRGNAGDGALALVSKHGASRLVGRLQGGSVVGTLWIGAKKWEFSVADVDSSYPNGEDGDGVA
jgi:hypothetical protein